MRMRKLFVGLLVLGLTVSVTGMVGVAWYGGWAPCDMAIVDITWTIGGFIELTIDDSSYDFGTINAGVDTVSDDEANTLFVRSNRDWDLGYSVEGAGSEYLQVSLATESGEGNATINVGYTLLNLRSMDPGDYSVTVTYTATAK